MTAYVTQVVYMAPETFSNFGTSTVSAGGSTPPMSMPALAEGEESEGVPSTLTCDVAQPDTAGAHPEGAGAASGGAAAGGASSAQKSGASGADGASLTAGSSAAQIRLTEKVRCRQKVTD